MMREELVRVIGDVSFGVGGASLAYQMYGIMRLRLLP
jgi:hypothetical protein